MTSFDQVKGTVFSPLSWRIGVRRFVLLTLPISLPVWIVLMILVGILAFFGAIIRPILILWNEPPVPTESDYYGYRPDSPLKDLRRLDDDHIIDISKRAA